MVIGKLKYLIGPASGTISYPLGRSRFIFLSGCMGLEWSDSVVGVVSRIHDPEKRGKIAWAGTKSIPMRVV